MIIKIDTHIKLMEKDKRKKNIIQGCTYQKYYLKINIFYFKNKFHLYKDKIKIIDKSEKLLQIKCIQNNKKNNF